MKKILISLMLVTLLLPSLVFADVECEDGYRYDEEKSECVPIIIGYYVDALKMKVNLNMYAVNVYGQTVVVNYLTTQFGSSTVEVKNVSTGATETYYHGRVVTYHTVSFSLESGIYEVLPVIDEQGIRVVGIVRTIIVE